MTFNTKFRFLKRERLSQTSLVLNHKSSIQSQDWYSIQMLVFDPKVGIQFQCWYSIPRLVFNSKLGIQSHGCYSVLVSVFNPKLSAFIQSTTYNFDPLKPHFLYSKTRFTGVYIIFFFFLLKNTDYGYSLEPPRRGGSKPPRRGGSNEYPQSMF